MGLYRMVLESNNCSLRMEKFNHTLDKYQIYQNCYSQLYSGASCNWLEVKNGTMRTDDGSIYSQLKDDNYAETALILDDTGIIQLQGVVADPQNPNKLIRFDKSLIQSQRKFDQHYIEAHSQINVTPTIAVQKTNLYNWTFAFNNGNLDISNPSGNMKRSFPLDNILYNQTGIFDKNTNAPLVLNDYQKSSSQIRFPYVLEVDKYLPIMRIYDQNKTLLQEFSVLDPSIPESLDELACPEYTYKFDGKCVRICPLGYYHHKNGTRGTCSLTHFPHSIDGRGSTIKNSSNMAHNYSLDFQPCPHLTTNYSYGCYCLRNKSF